MKGGGREQVSECGGHPVLYQAKHCQTTPHIPASSSTLKPYNDDPLHLRGRSAKSPGVTTIASPSQSSKKLIFLLMV